MMQYEGNKEDLNFVIEMIELYFAHKEIYDAVKK
jgi:hypothetical protein